MKRIFVMLLTVVLLLGICPMSALADTGGSGNVDGGGGGMGQGTSQNSWTPGMEGVRITVVDAESGQPVSTPFDLSSNTKSAGRYGYIAYASDALFYFPTLRLQITILAERKDRSVQNPSIISL